MNFEASIISLRNLKERAVRDRGIGTDLVAMAELWRDDQLIGMASLEGDIVPPKGEALKAAIVAHRADQVLFMSETYATIGPRERVQPYVEEQGRLTAAFAGGDRTVGEALLVITSTTEHSRAFYMPYRYEGRQVRWDRQYALSEMQLAITDGPLAAVARDALSHQPETAVEAAIEQFRAWGLRLVQPEPHEPVVWAERNAPCPCGSGMKYKRCHGTK